VNDLDRLSGELTIACNGIFLAYGETEFKPTYYVVEDHLVAEDRVQEINALVDSRQLFPLDLRPTLGDAEGRLYLPFRRHYGGFPRFQGDLTRPAYFGGTVTYLNLQLAFHLGCEQVILIGVDHSYVVPADSDGVVITSNSPDVNHFHQDYFGPGYRWHDPRVDRMEAAYREAARVFEAAGRTLVNGTRGGALEVFPRVDLDEVLER
jgi:hypothetical protein